MAGRETALNVLIACRKEAGWSNSVLKDYINRDRLDRREAALAARLCYGVIQNRGKLDFYLGQLLTGKVKSLHPLVRDVLHLGLYQIFEMDKIPPSAAVNESVALVKKYGVPSAKGLVNGVLRSALRNRETLEQPRSYVDIYSHPQKLIDKLKPYVGKEHMEAMLKANNQAPDTVIQVNTLKTTPEALTASLEDSGVGVQPHPWLPGSLILTGTGNLEALPAFQRGLFYVQDGAARLSVLCAGLSPAGERVLDCCAAPGGKSFAAAVQMAGRGTVVSCDIYAHKTALIEKGAARLGFPNITVRQQDASEFVPEWAEAFDTVLADVPCSGYGIIRKKPDIRYKDPDSMLGLPRLQLAILSNQARYVKPGGVLLYSTCTLIREENEGVVEEFLAQNPEFYTEALNLPPIFPQNDTGMLTLIPGQYDTDGFFICRLRRKPV